MTELKTLKDLNGVLFITSEDQKINNGWSNNDELRAEAIKWIKEIYKIQPDKDEPVTFIKHFFNISEEDLT